MTNHRPVPVKGKDSWSTEKGQASAPCSSWAIILHHSKWTTGEREEGSTVELHDPNTGVQCGEGNASFHLLCLQLRHKSGKVKPTCLFERLVMLAATDQNIEQEGAGILPPLGPAPARLPDRGLCSL